MVVGTTALLRGPTLPELALVLLPYADGFLYESDFRAAERYHRLLWALTELRPGRRPLLVLQTYTPRPPRPPGPSGGERGGLPLGGKGPAGGFRLPPQGAHGEAGGAPPAGGEGPGGGLRLKAALEGVAEEGEVLGPAPAPVSRVKGFYLYHLLLKGTTQRLEALLSHLDRRKFRLDPDPHRFVGLLED